MSSFSTSLGQEFAIERHLPKLGWKPDLHSPDLGSMGDGLGDLGGDDALGILVVFGVLILAILLIIFVVPLLIFVAELAVVIALIIPLTVLALVVGLKQHTVVLREKQHGKVVDQRSVHGVIGSLRAARAMKSAALAGTYGVTR